MKCLKCNGLNLTTESDSVRRVNMACSKLDRNPG